jgi:hypothetical protein
MVAVAAFKSSFAWQTEFFLGAAEKHDLVKYHKQRRLTREVPGGEWAAGSQVRNANLAVSFNSEKIMRALFDRTGRVQIWMHPKGKWLLDLMGHPLAFIIIDSVYDCNGAHVGWWECTKIRDHHGRMLLIDRKAMDLGPLNPPFRPRPRPPTIEGSMPTVPRLGAKPTSAFARKVEWADAGPFLDNLTAVQPMWF